ncbi:PilW family protein [Shewanella putrefaciens]|uniref:PilW family protein n=1 Tax=Shewanella putrefaciens TaxID=24 RepID=UPI0021BE72BA|nr:PilW family protein [Shewanella putrefaciens]UXK07686.1 PilW family protein [Shewanella putrefaciens]
MAIKRFNIAIIHYQTGLSLVELMVAMVIGLFLTAGVFTMFSMSSSNVTTTSQFNQLQENGRIALAILERDLSQLGFMGDMTGTDFVLGSNTQVNIAAVANDCVGDGLNNATLPNNTPAHFRRLWGYEQGVGASPFDCLNNVNNNTDVVQIKRLIGPSLAAPSGNNIFVVANASQAIFFTGNSSPTMTNGRIWEYQHHVYFISNDTAKTPVLRRKTLTNSGMNNDEQLVEGIENLRILYGFDNDGDDTPDSFLSAENVSNLMWENQTFQRLVALKLFVLVRSVQVDASYTNKTQYQLGDKTIEAPKDSYRRKVMSTTVVLENPVLIRS